MKALLFCLLATPALADPASDLCAQNPAFSRGIMLSVVQSQLQHDHDPALDADTPEHVADQAVAQGISECAAQMHADPTIAAALAGLDKTNATVGWDAYNTSCADRKTGKGLCITAEVGAASALRHMVTSDSPSGSKTLVETCELMMQSDPAMTDWRHCVDLGLAAHASSDRAKACKLSANWHTAHSGDEAGRAIVACLEGK